MSSNTDIGTLPSRAEMAEHKAFARVLASASRLVILTALARSDRPVGDLREMLGVSGPLLAWHLRMLKQEGLVSTSRRGRVAWYRLRKVEFTRKFQSLIRQTTGPDV